MKMEDNTSACCPKCGKQKVPNNTCPYCGVIYDRYVAPKVEQKKFEASRPERKNTLVGFIGLLLLMFFGFFIVKDQFFPDDTTPTRTSSTESNSKVKLEEEQQAKLSQLQMTAGQYKLTAPIPVELVTFQQEANKNPNGDSVRFVSKKGDDESLILFYNMWHVQHTSARVTPDELKDEIKFVLQSVNGKAQSQRHLRTDEKQLAFEVDAEGMIDDRKVIGRIRAIELDENEIGLIGFWGSDEKSLFLEEASDFIEGLQSEQIHQDNNLPSEGVKKIVTTEERKYYCGMSTRIPSKRVKMVSANDIPKTIRQAKGCLTVLQIYSSRCGICRTVAPKVVELRKKYANKGLAIIGYSVDPIKEDYELYLKELDYDLPYNALMIDSDNSRDDLYKVIDKIGVDWPGALPLFVLLDSDGSVLMRFTGSSDFSKLEKRIKQLL
jgi:thiol-disulfide isomerase/thioredoxin/ribosomal protein L32